MHIAERLEILATLDKNNFNHHHRIAELNLKIAQHHGHLYDLHTALGQSQLAKRHQKKYRLYRQIADEYKATARKTSTAKVSDDFALHERLQKHGYVRKANRDVPITLSKKGISRALTPDKFSTVEMHRYNHTSALGSEPHKLLHTHLMGEAFNYRAGKSPGYHHYSKGKTHVTIAPHSAGGHRVRFYHSITRNPL